MSRLMLLNGERDALWLGAPALEGGRGISLQVAGLVVHRASESPETYPWEQISAARLQAKVSMWRFPRVASWMMNLVAAVIDIWAPGDPPELQVVIVRPDEKAVVARATGYYLTGYVRQEVDACAELLRLCRTSAAVREQLDQPQTVLRAVEQAVASDAPARTLAAVMAGDTRPS